MKLTQQFAIGDYGTDKGAHGYLPHYDRHIDPSEVRTLVEIGVNEGHSLRLWRDWLTEATIIGLDIDPRCAELDLGERIHVVVTDATTYEPDFDYEVVIDDGSHDGNDQVAAFARFWPRLSSGGWFILEDLETAWHNGFEGHEQLQAFLWGSLVEAVLGLTPTADGMECQKEVAEVHVYEQIIFLRRR